MTDFENRLMDAIEDYAIGCNIEITEIYGNLYDNEGLTFELYDYLHKGRDFESDVESILPVIRDENPEFEKVELKEVKNKLTHYDTATVKYTLTFKGGE